MQWLNHYPVDKYLETNCIIHWTEIYQVDNAIQLLNNCGLDTLLGHVACLRVRNIRAMNIGFMLSLLTDA